MESGDRMSWPKKATACVLLLVASLVAAVPAGAQGGRDRIFRLAVLGQSALSLQLTRETTLPELERLGFVRGRTLDVADAFGDSASLPGLARELVAGKPDVLIAVGGEAVRAAAAATDQIPIVAFGPDPVLLGLARTLSRPGKNVTGIVILAAELEGKRLHLLSEAVPGMSRVGLLLYPRSTSAETSLREARDVGGRIGIEVLPINVEKAGDIGPALAGLKSAGAGAVVVSADPRLFNDTPTVVAEAARLGLPLACQWVEMAEAGCLLSYGPGLRQQRVRLADYVARLFRGAQPADMPVEQPTTFELAINLKTARALGLQIPPAVLSRAEQIIE